MNANKEVIDTQSPSIQKQQNIQMQQIKRTKSMQTYDYENEKIKMINHKVIEHKLIDSNNQLQQIKSHPNDSSKFIGHDKLSYQTELISYLQNSNIIQFLSISKGQSRQQTKINLLRSLLENSHEMLPETKTAKVAALDFIKQMLQKKYGSQIQIQQNELGLQDLIYQAFSSGNEMQNDSELDGMNEEEDEDEAEGASANEDDEEDQDGIFDYNQLEGDNDQEFAPDL